MCAVRCAGRWAAKWSFRAVVVYLVSMMPHRGGDMEVAQMMADLNCTGLPTYQLIADRGDIREQVQMAHQWNRIMVGEGNQAPGIFTVYSGRGQVRAAAIDHTFRTTDEVLDVVDGLIPLIGCVAREYDLPPALMAGIIAAAQDLDYNEIDAAVDSWLMTGWLDGLTFFDIGAGVANVHYRSLRPAVQSIGETGRVGAFARNHRESALRQDKAGWIRLSSRYPAYDLANLAVMARYYGQLRMGERPLMGMTAVDMAFVWSAYRGGVVNTAVDDRPGYRWDAVMYQHATDLFMLGDTVVALAYFRHYRAVFSVP